MNERQETDFGSIPKSWNVAKIADLKANDKRAIAMGPFGSNIKAENFVSEGVPVIRGTNLNYSRYVDGNFVYLKEEKADELIGSNCKPGDLVFTHRGTIGQVGLIPYGKHSRYVISQSGMKLSVHPDLMDSNFLLYFFKSEFGQYQILKYESQVGVPSISNPLTSLKEIQVPVPKLEEQKAIASVLSSLDDKIDLLNRQNTTLERMAETFFRQWFIEEAQEDWEEGRVRDLVNILSGFSFKSSLFKDNGEFKLITIKAVQDGYLELNNADRIQFLPEKLPEYCILTYGDILLSLTGNVGRCCIVDSEKLLLNQRVAKLQPKKTRDWAFTYVLFRQSSMKSQLEELAKGTAQANLSPIETANIVLKLPPDGLLEGFSLQTTPLLEKLLKNKKQIQTLEKLRDNLLPKLMSGEVRVVLQAESALYA